MRKYLRGFAIIGAVVAVLVVAMLVLDPFGLRFEITCENKIVTELPSPDKTHNAVLFDRDCGATTGSSSQISILKPGEKPSDGGNAFVAVAGLDEAPSGAWGGPLVYMRWANPHELLVFHDLRARVTFREKVSDVTIKYSASLIPNSAGQ